MRIQFLGAARTVTGSCFLVETAKSRFLVDCGMFQGSKALKEYNYGEFAFPVKDVDFVLLTHAHVDHCGLLPKLYKKGYKGPTYCTVPTRELCQVVLPDSGYIQEGKLSGKTASWLETANLYWSRFIPLRMPGTVFNTLKEYTLTRKFSRQRMCGWSFGRAGHILGAAILETLR